MDGGVESVVMNYYRNIDKSKVQFHFICDEDSTDIPYDEIEKLGGKVIIVPPYQKLFKYQKELYKIFGILQEDPAEFLSKNSQTDEIPKEIKELAEKRVEAKKNQNYQEADAIRDQIQAKGYALRDTKEGFEITRL